MRWNRTVTVPTVGAKKFCSGRSNSNLVLQCISFRRLVATHERVSTSNDESSIIDYDCAGEIGRGLREMA